MSFRQFLTILLARRAQVLLVTLAVLVAVAGVTVLLPKRYLATASVVVDPRATYTVAGASAPAGGRSGDVMSTQLDIIASPAVALRVVEALGLERQPEIGGLVAESRFLAKVRGWVSGWFAGDGDPGQRMDLKGWIADRLLRNLVVKANRDSYLIKLTYTAPDPGFAAAVANAFVDGYHATVLQLQTGPAKQSVRLFDEQIKGLKRDLEQAEAKLAKFQQQKGIVATDERLDLENTRLNELSAQLASAQSLSYESQAKQRQLRDFLGRGTGEAPAEVSASPVVQQLKQTLAEREAKLSELSRRVGVNHPQYQAAVSELERLRSQLRQEMRSSAQSMLAGTDVAPQREAALRGALEQQRSRVLGLKNDRNTLTMLMREAEGARQAYDAALQRFNQTRIASEVGQAGSTVVYPAAVPGGPAGPNLTLNIALALVAGLVLGVGVALFSETVNGYVRSERDIVELLGVPVFAVLVPRGSRRNVQYLRGPNVYSLPRL